MPRSTGARRLRAPDRHPSSAMSLSRAAILYGDGVNLAARLQTVAEPGGICISAVVHDHVANKVPVAFNDIGEPVLKNIVVGRAPFMAAQSVSRTGAGG